MSHCNSLRIRGRRLVTPSGVRPGEIRVADGRIVAVELPGEGSTAGETSMFDAGDALVLPGFVDTHVHVNEPGRTEWEGFATATDAAAAGGIATIVDMPLNCSPVTCSPPALQEKRVAAEGRLRVDCAFWGGIIPGNLGALPGLAEEGVVGFKCFLVDSGLPEFPPVAEEDLRPAMRTLAALGLPLLAHAELPDPIRHAARRLPASSRRYADWLASRPPQAETEAVALLLRLAEETGCPVHVVHVSAAECLPLIAEAKRRGVTVTAETCPHYLALSAEEVPDGATPFKCAPPIRASENRERLWAGLEDGTLDLVASDHSPCPPDARAPDTGDFFAAWGGIASLQLAPSVLWTAAAERGIAPARLADWISDAPARLAGLATRKGRIAPGYDADLVIFDPESEFVVDPAGLHARHPATPYEGRKLRGVVRRTWVRGRLVFADGHTVGGREGEILTRSDAEQP